MPEVKSAAHVATLWGPTKLCKFIRVFAVTAEVLRWNRLSDKE
jgi:hypothetical protein